MGELTFFLGLQVKQKEGGIFISQDKYVGEILKKFGFSSVRTANTPMETNKVLTKDEDGEDVDVHLYRSMIGSLMYLTSSRPDIMFSVCACSRFQVQPKVSHLNAVKRIFRYLKGRPNLGLWYPKDSPFILEAFLDSDYAGASLEKKSTTGGNGYRWQSQAPRHHRGAPAQTRSERVLETPNEPPLSKGHTSGSGKGRMEHQFELTANVPLTPHDLSLPRGYTPGSDEGRLPLHELMTMCTKLSKQVLDLEKEKDAQAMMIKIRRMHPNRGGVVTRQTNVMQLLKWKLHEKYGVHTLFMDGTPMEINMLVEKKYPLIKKLLKKMLNLQLEAEEEKREHDSFLVINLSGKIAQYNLISKTLHQIYDCGSNQLDDSHDDDDDELLQQFQAEHNVYEFIPSFASLQGPKRNSSLGGGLFVETTRVVQVDPVLGVVGARCFDLDLGFSDFVMAAFLELDPDLPL
ncbi:hypothetical protein Tco_0919103 [Tanacetum coccineum]